MAKLITKNFKAANHGAVANYVGMSPTFFDDKSNLSFLINYYPNGSLENFFEIDTLSISPTNIQIIFYGIASGMAFLINNLKLIPNLIKSNILLDEFLFPKISFYETIMNNHDYQCNNNTNNFRDRYNENILDESEGEQKEIFLFSLILYEFLMKKKPFKKLNTITVQKLKIVGGLICQIVQLSKKFVKH